MIRYAFKTFKAKANVCLSFKSEMIRCVFKTFKACGSVSSKP